MAYTQQQRLMAYNVFLETGNMDEVVKRTNIARRTLFLWKKEDDWDEMIKQFRDKVRATLEESGISKQLVKDEDLLRVGRILFAMIYTALRPTISDNDGNKVPNPDRVMPKSISDIFTILTKVKTMQNEILGRQPGEEVSDREYTEEEVRIINKILLKGQTYDADEDRRKAAEEFRNRQARSSSEIPL